MKKLLFTVVLFFSALVLYAQENTVVVNGISYNLNKETFTAEVVKNDTGYDGVIEIPQSIEYESTKYDVTAIASMSFSLSPITEVTLPEGLKSIGNHAFFYCHELKSINFPKSLESIGDWALDQCELLETIELPENIKLGKGVFTGCLALKNVIIPDDITDLGNWTFWNCPSLEEIKLPGKLTSIGEGTFDECKNLRSITIPEGVTTIGADAFAKCESLTEIVIPDAVVGINLSAFTFCTNLEKVTLSANLEYIDHEVFISSPAIKEVYVRSTNPSKMSLENDSFDEDVFKNATLFVPKGHLGKYESSGWIKFANMKEFEYQDIENNTVCVNGIYYNLNKENNTAAVTYGDNKYIGSVSIPSVVNYDGTEYTVVCIDYKAFENCTELTEVIMSDNITVINNDAFAHCSMLENVILPKNIEKIRKAAFNGCSSLKKITLPSKLVSLREKAFAACSNLMEITSEVANPAEFIIFKSSFDDDTYRQATLYVPNGSVSLYQEDEDWGLFKNIKGSDETTPDFAFIDGVYYHLFASDNIAKVTYGEEPYKGNVTVPANVTYNGNTYSVTEIEEKAFYANKELKTVKLPETVNKFGYMSFCLSSSLTDVTMPSALKFIDAYAFFGCSSLKEIYIPESVDSIGNWAFDACSSITTFVLPEGVKIGKGLLTDCQSIKEIYLPKDLTDLGDWTFWNCISLEKVHMSENTEIIGEGTFNGCSAITEMVLPNTVTAIGATGFSRCSNLKKIHLSDKLEYIDGAAFSLCESLEEINLPNSLQFMGCEVFTSCPSLKSIYSEIENPSAMTVLYDTFEDVIFENATLYVPKGTKDLYMSTATWKNFKNIEEFDYTGIDNVSNDNDNSAIYDLRGVRVSVPSKGIYIKNGKKFVVR